MIIFETPGLIDPRSFTVMGLSAKPNSENPIGYFGTGLKYAIATLTRLSAKVVIYIGRDRYEFTTKTDNFRGKEYQRIQMRLRKWTVIRSKITDLPYTTEYGRNWESWQAYRELESNTRDEGGETRHHPKWPAELEGSENKTYIAVELPAFDQAWERRDEIFLPDAKRTTNYLSNQSVEIFNGQSHWIYWRGLAVKKLEKPTFKTYNVLSYMKLTEDRTLDGDWAVKDAIGTELVSMDNEDLIKDIISCGKDFWEHNIELPGWRKPSPAFRSAASRGGSHWPSVREYHARHDDTPIAESADLKDVHPAPWSVGDEEIRDAESRIVCIRPHGYRGNWSAVAKLIVEKMNG